MAIATLNWEDEAPGHCRDGAVAIGNFDGVHRGHAALLAELRRQADAIRGPAVAVTFDPPPLQLLRPPPFQPVLSLPFERAALMQAHGADHVLILQTTPTLLHVPAADFFHEFVRHRLGAKVMVEGVNFGFGRDREGNVDTLHRLCEETSLQLIVVPPQDWNGIIVSSSRVRAALRQGQVRDAADMLGRLYHLRGNVGTGRRRGQTLGFPTANLEKVGTLVPGDGVYAVRVHYDGKTWPGAANVGANPTFGEQERKLEVHLIGFQGDLVGKELTVEFVDRLRDTKPFPSVEELVEQLRLDVEHARHAVTQ